MNQTLSLVLSMTLAAMFWTAFVVLVTVLRHRHYNIGPVITFWSAHVAIFWTVSFVRRVAFGYVGPSSTMTYWSIILYLQAGLSILGMLFLSRHRLPPST